MDIQTRKKIFVQEFLKLESENVIFQLEKLLFKSKENNADFNPMTIEQLQNRINQSSEDSKNGRLTETDDLLSEIEKWS